MSCSLGRADSVVVGAVGAGSVLAGLVLAFRLVTPDQVGGLSTLELLGLVGLLLLPVLTLWMGALARKASAQAAPAGVKELAVEPPASTASTFFELKPTPLAQHHRRRMKPRVELVAAPSRTAA